jgi:hypothetical protein
MTTELPVSCASSVHTLWTIVVPRIRELDALHGRPMLSRLLAGLYEAVVVLRRPIEQLVCRRQPHMLEPFLLAALRSGWKAASALVPPGSYPPRPKLRCEIAMWCASRIGPGPEYVMGGGHRKTRRCFLGGHPDLLDNLVEVACETGTPCVPPSDRFGKNLLGPEELDVSAWCSADARALSKRVGDMLSSAELSPEQKATRFNAVIATIVGCVPGRLRPGAMHALELYGLFRMAGSNAGRSLIDDATPFDRLCGNLHAIGNADMQIVSGSVVGRNVGLFTHVVLMATRRRWHWAAAIDWARRDHASEFQEIAALVPEYTHLSISRAAELFLDILLTPPVDRLCCGAYGGVNVGLWPAVDEVIRQTSRRGRAHARWSLDELFVATCDDRGISPNSVHGLGVAIESLRLCAGSGREMGIMGTVVVPRLANSGWTRPPERHRECDGGEGVAPSVLAARRWIAELAWRCKDGSLSYHAMLAMVRWTVDTIDALCGRLDRPRYGRRSAAAAPPLRDSYDPAVLSRARPLHGASLGHPQRTPRRCRVFCAGIWPHTVDRRLPGSAGTSVVP